eukprot:TRINITY_DN2622_c0_g1_i1.p1 TRINITY_DN2622_c0_g1~~TRINITY_DN2622_c0_g1_i1.p1  ORF type:complete len:1183 (-),score=324.64 TRINITY_DN2622_c0_g1_i1:2249-5797(-)
MEGRTDAGFISEIVNVSKKILAETKQLREIGEQRLEDQLLESTKKTALVTFELVELVQEKVKQGTSNRNTTEDDFTVAEFHLGEATNLVRSSVLSLIEAVKSGVANPFDFLSQQNVDNTSKDVVSAITQILNAVKTFNVIDTNEQHIKSQEILIQNIKSANMALYTMSQAFDTNNQVSFTNASKSFISSVGQLVEYSRNVDLGLEDEMKACTIELIQGARMAISSPEDENAIEQWMRARQATTNVIEKFIFQSLSSGKANNGPLSRANWNQLMKPESSKTNPLSIPLPTSPTISSPSSNPPPVKRAPPPVPPIPTKKPTLVESNSLPSPQRDNGPASPTGRPSQATLKRGASNITMGERKETISPTPPLQQSASLNSLKESTSLEEVNPIEKTKKEVATKIVSAFCNNYPSFKLEWNRQTTDVIEKMMQTLIMENLRPLLANHSGALTLRGGVGDTEDDDDISELRKLLDEPNIEKMSYELKSFTRRLEKKSRQQKTLGRSATLTLPISDFAESPTNLEEDLKDCLRDYREVMNKLVSTLSESMSTFTSNTENAQLDTMSLSNAVSKIYKDTLLLLMEAAKLGQVWLQNHKDEETNTKKLSTKKAEAKAAANDFKEKHKYYILNYISQTMSLIDKAQPKGKADKSITNLITESEGESAEYLSSFKTKIVESLQGQLSYDCGILKSLAIQLVTTLKYLSSKRSTEMGVMLLCTLVRTNLDCGTNILNTFETLCHISNPRYLKTTGSSLSIKGALELPSSEASKQKAMNIWADNTTLRRNDEEVMGGTLNQIINFLTYESTEQNFLKTFIITYQSFTTPYTLLEKLEQRYRGPPKDCPPIDNQMLLKIKMRVCVVLKIWIELQFDDFDPQLSRKLQLFISDVIGKDPQMGEMAKRLHSQIEAKKSAIRIERAEINSEIRIPEKDLCPVDLFYSKGEAEIARSLTMLEFALFKRIKASELLNQAWNSVKLRHKAVNVSALIARANKISFWVASLIVWQNKISDRVKVIEKFIKIAEHLNKMCNFNSLIAIIAGLNVSAVSRLKFTWDAVEKSATETLKRLQSIFDPANSNKSYRKERNEATSKEAVMPYIGVTLSDLTFAEDGNKDFLKDDPTLINFAKRVLVSRLIMDLQLNQQKTYQFEFPSEDFIFLQDLPHCSEKDLYDLSLIKEPRGATAQQIAKMEAEL